MFGKRRFIWQLYLSMLLITTLSLIAVSWYATTALRDFHLDQTREDLEARAHLVQHELGPGVFPGDPALIDSLCKKLGESSSTRITVILPSGVVLGDTEENPGRMENHAGRPEISEAYGGRVGSSIRYSTTVKTTMMYVAIPLRENGSVAGVVRTSIPVTAIDDALRSIFYRIALSGLIIALLAAALSYYLSSRISRPLEELRRGAELFARGELEARLPVYESEEVGSLAETMNHMAAELDDRIRTVVKQRNEQQAVLASMVEGVLAVDDNQRVLNLNQAAARLFELDTAETKGRSLSEVIDNRALQDFVSRILDSREVLDEEIVLGHESGRARHLHAHGTPLLDSQGFFIGALTVLHDQTRLRMLEAMRREFVSNVSHELKTPVTSIKGFVETLLDGVLDDPEDTGKFLRIISRHADRLNAIIEDLLSLSHIEQEEESDEIELETGSLCDVLRSAVLFCEMKARDKKIEISLDCPEDIRASMNPPLLEQAVINLIDNAIKYSDPGGRVEVSARLEDGEAVIDVLDSGCGIDSEHHERIFERFYRVDKARSRKLGGTGLGLAIVKHIAGCHSGGVRLRSAPGEGSTFTIHIPVAT